ncbi:MAG TPA: META domain-containing protein [Leptolyngbyaceae cyanobacterium M65_K2018_010]|nr:META domain-containing protein [Leptolyngbyaceae cyanobacterium M65_K2018_010]
MANPAIALEGPVWGLTHYRNAAGEWVAAEVYGIQSPSIQFTDGAIAGNGTCNRFFGSYQVTDHQLSVRPGGSTLMACPPPYMEQEQAFLAALAQVSRSQLVEGELQLLDASGTPLLAFSELVPPALTGNLWELTAYNNGRGAVTSLLTDTRITATFNGEGRLTGSAGCNTYNARYTVTDGSITISPPASTRKYCAQPEGLMDQEIAYLTALTTAATYQLEENRLTLKTADGATVAQFSLVAEER